MAKATDKVAPNDLACRLQSHGSPGRETLDKSPLSCGNPPWHTALRWLEQTRGAVSPNFTPRACWPRHRKGAANCLNCKEIDQVRGPQRRQMCAVAQVPETSGFMPVRDSGTLASTHALLSRGWSLVRGAGLRPKPWAEGYAEKAAEWRKWGAVNSRLPAKLSSSTARNGCRCGSCA